MGLKPQALNGADKVYLGWELDRHATGYMGSH